MNSWFYGAKIEGIICAAFLTFTLIQIQSLPMLKTNTDLGLLLLRLWFGLEMAIAHGLPKLNKLLAGDLGFPDPLGVGSGISLGLATFGELVCGLLIAVGLFTRLSTIPYMITMLVAGLIFHIDDGWGKIASPLMYFVPALVLFITGPGKHSLDALLDRRKMA